jgi:hypothetical protein
MLVQLIYSSRVASSVDNAAIRDILAKSQANNRRQAITGALCFSGTWFLQSLEGERAAINRLYGRLITDARHSDSQVLSFEEIAARDYTDWDMGYVAITAENQQLFLKYSTSNELDPPSLSAASVRGLFRDLAARANWLKKQP